MPEFRDRDLQTVEAYQWFKHGDHPKDNCRLLDTLEGAERRTVLSEGEVVRRFHSKEVEPTDRCAACREEFSKHGWIHAPHYLTVCPGDWIITLPDGTYWAQSPDRFDLTHVQAAPAVPKNKHKDRIKAIDQEIGDRELRCMKLAHRIMEIRVEIEETRLRQHAEHTLIYQLGLERQQLTEEDA